MKTVLLIWMLLFWSVPELSAKELCAQSFGVIALGQNPVMVEMSSDAGNYYCAHAFCVSQILAEKMIPTLRNAHLEPLVGFLHFPYPSFSRLFESKQEAQTIVGASLRAYVEEAKQHERNIRVLLQGFENFDPHSNNPTEDFLQADDEVSSALETAFEGEILKLKKNSPYLWYVHLGGRSPIRIEIYTHVLPVNDHAIDAGSPTSVFAHMQRHHPHAILSLGLGIEEHFQIETLVTDRGLSMGPPLRHDPDAPPRFSRRNFSLWRALQRVNVSRGENSDSR
jgi:hypothetical protein